MLQKIKISVMAALLWVGLAVCVFGQNAPAYFLRGRVQDAAGKPLPQANAHIHETRQGALTDTAGYFKIGPLTAGSYHLHVEFLGYVAFSQTVDLRKADAEITVTLQETSLELRGVVIESDLFKDDARERSQAIEQVEKDFLFKNQSPSLMQTLARLPGVETINTGVGIAKPVIRGLSFNRVVVVENGIKQEGQQWGADHGLEIDKFNVDRVELLKGPASLVYGSDAVGGVLNVQPAKVPYENGASGEGAFNYATNNHLFGATAMAMGARNGFVFRARVSGQSYADYRVPATQFTYNRYVLPLAKGALKNTAGQDINGSLLLGLQKKWGYTFVTASWYDQKAGLFAGAVGVPRAYQLADDGAPRSIDLPYFRTQHLKVVSNTRLLLRRNWLEIDAGYQRNLRREFSNPHAHGVQPVATGNEAVRLTLQTFDLNLRYHHKLWLLDGIAGVSAMYQTNRFGGFEFLLPAFAQQQYGAFWFEKYKVNSRLTLNGGLRFDLGALNIQKHWEPVYADSVTIESYYERNPDIRRLFSSVSGSGGLSFFPIEELNIKFNAGVSFRYPAPVELSVNGIHHGAFRHERGDANLLPERGYQTDLNFVYHNKKCMVSLSPFFGYFQRYIYLNPTFEYSQLPGGGQIYQYSQTNALHWGAELTAEYHVLKQLHLAFLGEYAGLYNIAEGLSMPFTPPPSGILEAEYVFEKIGKGFGNLFLKIEGQYYAPQNAVARNENATPGALLAHASAGIDFKAKKQRIRLVFQAQNLLNTPYLRHLSRYRLLNLPEAGRNFQLSLEISLGK